MPYSKTSVYKSITIAAYFLLFPLVLLWQLDEFNNGTSMRIIAIMLFVLLAPLLVLMAGIATGDPKTYQWSLFLSMLYFVHGTMEAYALSSTRLYSGLEVVLSIIWFVFAILYIRSLGKPIAKTK